MSQSSTVIEGGSAMFWRQVLVIIGFVSLQTYVAGTLPAAEPTLTPVSTPGHDYPIYISALSPDGKLVVTSTSKTAILATTAGETLRIFKDLYETIEDLCFSNDSKLLIFTSGEHCEIWNLATGSKLSLPKDLVEPRSVVLSGDGKLLAAGNPRDNNYAVWDLTTGKQLQNFSEHTDRVTCAYFSPDGKTLFTGSADTSVIVWNLITGNKTKRLLNHRGALKSLSLSKDGKFLLAHAGYEMTIWNVETGEKLQSMGDENQPITAAVFASDGKSLVYGNSEGLLTLWNVTKGVPLRTLTANKEEIKRLMLSADNKVLLALSNSGTVTLWDLVKGVPMRTIGYTMDEIYSVHVSGDGKVLAAHYKESGIFLWNLQTGERLNRLTPPNPGETILLSHDGKYLFTCGESTINVWNAATGANVKKLAFPLKNDFVRSLDITPDSKFLVTGLANTGTAILWNVADGQILRLFRGHEHSVYKVSLSADAKTLATSSGDMAYVWNAANGDKLATIHDHTKSISSLQLSRDGKTLATGSDDAKAILWNAATGERLQTLDCQYSVAALRFSADEKSLFTLNHLGKLLRWEVATGKLLSSAKEHHGKHLYLVTTKGGNFTITASSKIQLHETDTGKERLAIHGQGSEWVAMTPDGKVDGSPNGLKSLLAIRVGDTNEYHPVERHRAKFVVPKLLGKILRGEPLEADAKAPVK